MLPFRRFDSQLATRVISRGSRTTSVLVRASRCGTSGAFLLDQAWLSQTDACHLIASSELRHWANQRERTKTAELEAPPFRFVISAFLPHPTPPHTSLPRLPIKHRPYQGPQTLEIFDGPIGVARHFP